MFAVGMKSRQKVFVGIFAQKTHTQTGRKKNGVYDVASIEHRIPFFNVRKKYP